MNFKQFKEQFERVAVTEYPNKVDEKPMVSICVQTFNQVEYIAQCLDSILEQQTNFSYEILLGDDSSTDGTKEICENYVTRFPDKIRLFLHKKKNNIKVEGNFTGLFNSIYNFYSARGKYLAYCDGDDYWTDPHKLQKQVDFLELHKDVVITYHAALFVNEQGNPIEDNGFISKTYRNFSSEELQKAIIQPVISTWCFRNIVNQIPVELTQTLNADNFWISLLGSYGSGKFLTDILPSHYRIHKEGIWSLIEKEKQLNSKRITYNNLCNFYLKQENKKLGHYFKKRSRNYTKMLIVHQLKKLYIIKAFKYSFLLVK